MDLVVDHDSIHCESRPVKANITYICSSKSACTVGKEGLPLQGQLTYYGLKDIFDATNADSLKIHAHVNLFMLPGFMERQQLMTMATVPLCGSFVNDEYNRYKYCPADGTYNFDTAFQMEGLNDFVAWLRTGYRGELIVNMYLDTTMSLVGRCTMGIRTKPSVPILSGMLVSTMLILSLCVTIGYMVSRRVRSQGSLRWPQRNSRSEELLPYDHKLRNKVMPYKLQPKPEPVTEELVW